MWKFEMWKNGNLKIFRCGELKKGNYVHLKMWACQNTKIWWGENVNK